MNYPYLPQGRTILYVPVQDRFMSEAKKERDENSSDAQHPTGAVVVRDGVIIGRGANQCAIKNKWFSDFHKNKFCMRRFLAIKSGHKYWLCPGCAAFRHHAESRAVKNAKRNVKDVTGSDLYLYGHWWCCKPCWDKMVGAGIKDVYLVDGATELFADKKRLQS